MNSLLPIADCYKTTLLEVHWAAQIPAAASRLLEPQADWSHTNLLVEDGVLRGRPLPNGERVEIDITTLIVRIGEAECRLKGQTTRQALDWLSERLHAPFELLAHEIPSRPADKPFVIYGAEPQLFAWFELAQRQLKAVAAAHGGSEVRLWPHHFDIATLIEIDSGGDEEARSINLGLSPGDAAYSEPYWYVTPWPRPSAPLPSLSIGHWHRDGFTAAVFPASAHHTESLDSSISDFLAESVAHCRELLRHAHEA